MRIIYNHGPLQFMLHAAVQGGGQLQNALGELRTSHVDDRWEFLPVARAQGSGGGDGGGGGGGGRRRRRRRRRRRVGVG
jgi:hypothetical protein